MPQHLINQLVIFITGLVVLWGFFRLLVNRKQELRFSLRSELILFLFFIYIISVMSLTIMPLPIPVFERPDNGGINIIPLKNILTGISDILFHKETSDTENISENLLGNIVMFIPLGMLLPFFSGTFRSLQKVALFAFACSCAIELTQLTLRLIKIYRFVDIDDVILNTTGAALGFILINKFFFKRRKRQRRIEFY